MKKAAWRRSGQIKQRGSKAFCCLPSEARQLSSVGGPPLGVGGPSGRRIGEMMAELRHQQMAKAGRGRMPFRNRRLATVRKTIGCVCISMGEFSNHFNLPPRET